MKDNRDVHLFPSQRSDRITTACIRNLVRKYVTLAKSNNPNHFKKEDYSPHSFRHSKTVHMLEAGIPLIYIRNFLGHESIQTTEIYLRIHQSSVSKILKEKLKQVYRIYLNTRFGKSGYTRFYPECKIIIML